MAITVTGGPAYGASWNKTGGGATLTRLASAAGLTAGTSFNAIAPWTMRRCNLWDDGTATAYYGDRCYTDADVTNMGQAMVSIPKFYYYMEYDAGTTTYYWFVTTNATTTIDVGLGVGAQAVKLHPTFTRDSVTKNQIYLGAYEAYYNTTTTMLESKASVAPTASKTVTQFTTAARLRAGAVNNKWELQDYLTTSAVQLLYLIEYASFSSQHVLGGGLTNSGAVTNTGGTTAYGNVSYGTPDAYTTAMSYRGIENFWGNLYTAVGGISIKGNGAGDDYNVWIADHDFIVDTFAHPYSDTLLNVGNTAGYVEDITTSTTYDYGFIPSTVGGALGTYLCDYFYCATGNRVAYFGGYYTAGGGTPGTRAGGFAWNVDGASGTSGVILGTRLMYMG